MDLARRDHRAVCRHIRAKLRTTSPGISHLGILGRHRIVLTRWPTVKCRSMARPVRSLCLRMQRMTATNCRRHTSNKAIIHRLQIRAGQTIISTARYTTNLPLSPMHNHRPLARARQGSVPSRLRASQCTLILIIQGLRQRTNNKTRDFRLARSPRKARDNGCIPWQDNRRMGRGRLKTQPPLYSGQGRPTNPS